MADAEWDLSTSRDANGFRYMINRKLFHRLAGACLPLLVAPATALTVGVTPASAATDPAPGATGSTFTQVFQDDFNGTSLDRTVWGVYNNPTGKVPRSAANVSVHDGMVTLQTRFDAAQGHWTAAGMSATRNKSLIQTYGKYEMRVRSSAGDSRVVALLWPTKGWPPEIDWMEMGASGTQGSRQVSTQTVHYGGNNSMIHSNYTADMTQWHTVGVEWLPGVVNYTLDGVVMRSIASANVPSQPMWVGLQTRASNAPAVPVNVDVDWLRIYSYAPGGGSNAGSRPGAAPGIETGGKPTAVAPRVISAPAVRARTGATLSRFGRLPVTVTWGTAPGSSPLCGTQVQRSFSGGEWTPVSVGSPAATSAPDKLPATGKVRYRVRVAGCDGTRSNWSTGPALASSARQESASSLRYSGSWKLVKCAACSGGKARATDTDGAVRTSVSGGRTVALVVTAGPRQGAGKVYLDGTLAGTFDGHASRLIPRKVVFELTLPGTGRHTVSLVGVPAPGRTGFQLDALEILAG